MQSPLVYVIIINWNGREHLEACFQSLLASTYPNAVFLLVDNASSDGSVAYVEQNFGDDERVAVLALPENRGWSGGNNAGIHRARAAGSDYLFLLNNDTATAPDALQLLVDQMVADASLGALAPRMVLFDQPELLNSVGLTLSIIGAAWDTGIGRIDGPQWHTPESVVGVCGGALFLRARVLDDTGLLPENFEIYLDDLDLCLRIWSAGHRIQRCAGAVVRHKFSATMGEGARTRYKYYLNTRNRFRIVLRHFPASALPIIVPRLLLGECRALGRAMLSGNFWRLGVHCRAWLSALAYLPAAWRYRRANHVSDSSPFWPMVVRSPLFCPALQLPVAGWYPQESWQGAPVSPMAACAWLEIPPGTLQVSLVNCYPAISDARITLSHSDCPLATLESNGTSEATIEVEGGMIRIVAESIFPLETTGAPADRGAWLRLRHNGRDLVPPQ